MTKQKFEEIYRKHYPEMYRLARTILYDEDESKDAVSEVFTKLLRADIEPQEDKMQGYLMTSVRNKCRDEATGGKPVCSRLETGTGCNHQRRRKTGPYQRVCEARTVATEPADTATEISGRNEVRRGGRSGWSEPGDSAPTSERGATANQRVY